MNLVIVFILGFDRLLKYLVMRNLVPGHEVVFLPSQVNLVQLSNTGGAYGVFSGKTPLLTLAGVIGVVALFGAYRCTKDSVMRFGMAMVLGGALGNLFDRLAFGYVVDYIHVLSFPAVFNFADFVIMLGTGLILSSLIVPGRKAFSEGAESGIISPAPEALTCEEAGGTPQE